MNAEFKKELVESLKKTIEWSSKFEDEKDFSFDIDTELFILSEKYGVDFKRDLLFLIYNLVDFYCDAIKHGFKEIDKNYSVVEANNDIRLIISHLELSENIEIPPRLENKLKNIFSIKKNNSWLKKIIKFFSN